MQQRSTHHAVDNNRIRPLRALGAACILNGWSTLSLLLQRALRLMLTLAAISYAEGATRVLSSNGRRSACPIGSIKDDANVSVASLSRVAFGRGPHRISHRFCAKGLGRVPHQR